VNKAISAMLLLAAQGACRREPTAALAPGSGAVPSTTSDIKIDGEWDEPDWSKNSLRFQFVGSDGQLARPSSEIRLIHDKATLYVGLYAADENIQSGKDAFELDVGGFAVRIDATGKVDPPTADIKVGVDRDGTLDDPHNNDEEWVIEAAIPLRELSFGAGTPVQAKARRCDVTKDGVERCGSWSGALTLR
jgi:hypothetical protein